MARWVFSRVLGVILRCAFASLGWQIRGLAGARGIVPAQPCSMRLEQIRSHRAVGGAQQAILLESADEADEHRARTDCRHVTSRRAIVIAPAALRQAYVVGHLPQRDEIVFVPNGIEPRLGRHNATRAPRGREFASRGSEPAQRKMTPSTRAKTQRAW